MEQGQWSLLWNLACDPQASPALPTTWETGSLTLVPRTKDAGWLAWKGWIPVFVAKKVLG